MRLGQPRLRLMAGVGSPGGPRDSQLLSRITLQCFEQIANLLNRSDLLWPSPAEQFDPDVFAPEAVVRSKRTLRYLLEGPHSLAVFFQITVEIFGLALTNRCHLLRLRQSENPMQLPEVDSRVVEGSECVL